MKPQEIVLLVSIIVGSIIVLFIVLDVIFVISFNNLFKKHKKSMTIFLDLKYENVKKLLTYFEEYHIEIDPLIKERFDKIDLKAFFIPDSVLSMKSLESLTYIKDELFYLGRITPLISNDEQFIEIRDGIKSLINQYRNTVAQYNADVLGYNYWVSFWPTKWIWRLFKFKSKSLLNI